MARVVEGKAYTGLKAAKGQELFFQLLNAVDLTVDIREDARAASIGAAHNAADATVLHLKAVGLVVGHPLLFKCLDKNAKTLDDLGVILFCKLSQGLLVACLVSAARAQT